MTVSPYLMNLRHRPGDPAWAIFEGPDGAGKSTAALTLLSELADKRGPTAFQHLTSKSEEHEYDLPFTWVANGLNVVQDRCFLSDLTYAPVLRGVASKFGEATVRRQLELVARRAVVIHVTADEADLRERLAERGDDLIDESMLHAILKNYWREVGWWQEAGAAVYTFDTTGGEFPSALELSLAVSAGTLRLAANAR